MGRPNTSLIEIRSGRERMGMTNDELFERISRDPDALLEIYVLGSTFEDWRRTLEGLDQYGYVESLSRRGAVVPLEVAPEMFTEGEQVDYLLRLKIGDQVWTSGLYSSTMIDFQCDARDVRSTRDLADIADFMSAIRKLLGKRVILVPETLTPESTSPYLEIA
jgi:hypothetical protein